MTGEGQTAMADAAQASLRAEAGEEKIKVMLSDIERLRRDIDALQAVRRDLESKVGVMAAALVESRSELDQSEDETAAVRPTSPRSSRYDGGARSAPLRREGADGARPAHVEEREIRLAEVQALHLAAQSSLAGNEER